MIFRDRSDAAEQLAAALAHWRGKGPLVLAIPRGGVVVGAMLAGAGHSEADAWADEARPNDY